MSFRVGRPPSRQSRVQSLVPCLLFGVPSPFLLVVPRGPTCPAGGLFPLRGVTSGVHSSRGAPARYVPSPGFLNLSTAFSTCGFAGLLHPAATSRVSPFRGFSRRAAGSTRRRSVPPHRCRPFAHRLAPAATSRRLGHEALLRSAMRSSRKVFSLPVGRSPLRFLPPPGFRSPAACPVPRVVRS